MSFSTFPWWIVGMLGAAVAAAIVALYLLRRTPRAQVVSNLMFWIEAQKRARPKLLASTRIPLLSLLLSLLVASLLVVELGGPRFGDGVRGTTVIVVAAGRTMGAEEAGRTRIDRALDDARSWADRAAGSGEISVVRAGIAPRVIVPLTSDGAEVARALSEIALDDGATDLDGAIALADAIVSERGGAGQILVFADSAPETTTRTPLVLVPAGAQADTVAIARLVARRDPIAVGEYAVEAEVRSFTSRQSRARLIVRDRDVVILDQAVALGPFEALPVRGQGFSSAQAELTAVLEEIEIAGSRDALAADDVAHAVAAPLDTLRVLVASESPYLERLLAVHPSVEAEVIAPSALRSADAAAFDVVIAEGASPIDHPALFLIAPPTHAALPSGAELDAPRVTATLASHPALGGVRLDAMRLDRARSLEPQPGDRVLARSGAHALAVARERAGTRMVALGFALDDTDLVEQVAFPLMVHHTLRWLSAHDRLPPVPLRPGEPIVAGAGATVLDPSGEPVEVHGGVTDDTTRSGIYHASRGDEAAATAIAVSGAVESGPLHGAGVATARARSASLPPLAALVAFALLLLVFVEWALLHRGRLS